MKFNGWMDGWFDWLDKRMDKRKEVMEVMKSAQIDEDAKLSESCVIGHNVIIEAGVSIGEFVTIGEHSIIGSNVHIANHVRIYGQSVLRNVEGSTRGNLSIGEHTTIQRCCMILGGYVMDNVFIGKYSTIIDTAIGSCSVLIGKNTIGPDVVLEEHCEVPFGTCLGIGTRMGARAKDIIDLGMCDGYRKVLAQVGGVAYIGAGCRWMPLMQIIRHWEWREDRAASRRMMQRALILAAERGWKLDEPQPRPPISEVEE